jgi:hypothetical protein
MHHEDGALVANNIVKFQGYVTSRRSQPMNKSATEIPKQCKGTSIKTNKDQS